MAVEGFERCPVCNRKIIMPTEVRSKMCADGRAHMVHKKCHPDYKPEPEQLGGFTPSVDVVITPEEKVPTGANYISTTANEPSMPIKEQTGSRRTRKVPDEGK